MPEQIVVITSPGTIPDETGTWVDLLNAGLHRLHIRKPSLSKAQTRSLIEKVPVQWREKLVIHHHPDLVRDMNLGGCHLSYRDMAGMDNRKNTSCSVHSWAEAGAVIHRCSYVFISPVFDSISKPGYAADASLLNMPAHLRGLNMFALGGVNEVNARMALDNGYRGVALMGYLWKEPSSAVKLFERVVHQSDNII